MKGRVNVPIMLASLFLSLMLWLVVYAQRLPPESRRPISVPLVLDGLDPDKFVAVDQPEEFQSSVMASDEQMRELQRDKNIEAVADLRSAQPGRHMYRVRIFPERYRDLFDPSRVSVRLEIEPRAARTFKVSWDTRGDLREPSMRLDGAIVDPQMVEVSGRKSVVDRVARVRALLNLDEISAEVKKPQQVEAEVLDEAGRPIQDPDLRRSPVYVTLTPIVNPAPQEKLIFVMPNIQGRPAPGYATNGYEIDPNQITVRGRSQVLASLGQVMTDPIDINGLDRTKTFDLGLQLPRGIDWASHRRVKVRISIRQTPRVESASPPPVSDSAGGRR